MEQEAVRKALWAVGIGALLIILAAGALGCGPPPDEAKISMRVSSISQNLGKMAFEQMEIDTINANISNQLWSINSWSDVWAKFQMNPIPDGIFYLDWQLWYAPDGQPQSLFEEYLHAYSPCPDKYNCPIATGESIQPGYDIPIAIWDSVYDADGHYFPLSAFTVSGSYVERVTTGSRWEVRVLRMDGTLVAKGKLIIWWH